jgi:hypothetical protein
MKIKLFISKINEFEMIRHEAIHNILYTEYIKIKLLMLKIKEFDMIRREYTIFCHIYTSYIS